MRSNSLGLKSRFSSRPEAATRAAGGVQPAGRQLGGGVVSNNEPMTTLGDARLDTRVDGLLIVSLVPRPAEVEQFQNRSLPVVLVDTWNDVLPSVQVDHTSAAFLAVNHLLNLGHTSIGFVNRLEDPFAPTFSAGRREGYLRALAQHGLSARPEYLMLAEFSRAGGYAAASALHDLANPPTAIFAATDLQAIGVLEAAAARGLRVPQDLAVVGYNDVELAAFAGLTTVRLPTQEMGRLAVKLLLDLIEGRPCDSPHTLLQGELIIRQTCGATMRTVQPVL